MWKNDIAGEIGIDSFIIIRNRKNSVLSSHSREKWQWYQHLLSNLVLAQGGATLHLFKASFLEMWCKCWQKWNWLKLPAFVAGLLSIDCLDPWANRTCWGCLFLFPAPCMQQFLGLPAPPLTPQCLPRYQQHLSTCRRDATSLNKPRVPREPRACCGGTGLPWGASGWGVLKLQALHMLPGTCPWTSTQEMLDRNMGSLLSECNWWHLG